MRNQPPPFPKPAQPKNYILYQNTTPTSKTKSMQSPWKPNQKSCSLKTKSNHAWEDDLRKFLQSSQRRRFVDIWEDDLRRRFLQSRQRFSSRLVRIWQIFPDVGNSQLPRIDVHQSMISSFFYYPSPKPNFITNFEPESNGISPVPPEFWGTGQNLVPWFRC